MTIHERASTTNQTVGVDMKVRSYRRLVAASAALMLPALSASIGPAAAQTVDFRGDGTLSGFSAGCAEAGIEPGSSFDTRIRFRPAGVGDNGKSTRVSFFFDYYASSYRYDKGKLGNSFKPVFGGGTGSTTFYFENTVKMRITKLSPANISVSTKKVSISGEIQGFDDYPGCNANFSGNLVKG